MPTPAGMSLPMMTFSFRPTNGSTLPLIAACGNAAHRNNAVVRLFELEDIDKLAGQQIRVARIFDLNLTEHLANDNFDVLIGNFNALAAVNSLNFAEHISLNALDALDFEDIMRVD